MQIKTDRGEQQITCFAGKFIDQITGFTYSSIHIFLFFKQRSHFEVENVFLQTLAFMFLHEYLAFHKHFTDFL